MSILPTTQRSRSVHWAAWANGERWMLTPGVDHEQSARDALHAARTWAGPRGMRVVARLPTLGAPFSTPWTIQFVSKV